MALRLKFFVLGFLEGINTAAVRCQSIIRLAVTACLFVLFAIPVSSETIVMGPIRGDLGFQTGLEYTDNFNNSPKKVSNLYVNVGPTFTGGLNLPVHIGSTGGGEITLNSGLSYSEKISLTTNHIEQTFSSPITADLTIPLRFEAWEISAAESFSFNNTSLEAAVLASQEKVDQYNNTASINVTRNLGKAGLTFGFSRDDKMTPSTPTQDETDYQFSVTPTFNLRENYQLFWTTAYGMVFPKNSPTRQEVRSITTSIGVSGQITPAFNGSISVGYGLSHLSEKVLGPGQGIFGGLFDPLTLPAKDLGGISSSMAGAYTHPLHPNTTYSVSAYRSPGVTAMLSSSSIQAVTGVSLALAHQLSKSLTLMPSVQFQNMESLGTGPHQRENLLSVNMGISRQFSKRITMSVQYQYVNRISNQPNQTFDATKITVLGNYVF